MNDALSLSNWVAHVFDHPAANHAWHWEENVPQWEGNPETNAGFIADVFERSGELLEAFSDEQLDQGFWYLADGSCSDFMCALIEPGVAPKLRLRALRSFVPLFEQVMAPRCSPHLSHLDERGANPLNSACYMWWDILPFRFRSDSPERTEFDSEVLIILRRLLAIPQDACRESALHGLGHWCQYPDVSNIIDEFLYRAPDLRPKLVAYAQRAKTGVL